MSTVLGVLVKMGLLIGLWLNAVVLLLDTFILMRESNITRIHLAVFLASMLGAALTFLPMLLITVKCFQYDLFSDAES